MATPTAPAETAASPTRTGDAAGGDDGDRQRPGEPPTRASRPISPWTWPPALLGRPRRSLPRWPRPPPRASRPAPITTHSPRARGRRGRSGSHENEITSTPSATAISRRSSSSTPARGSRKRPLGGPPDLADLGPKHGRIGPRRTERPEPPASDTAAASAAWPPGRSAPASTAPPRKPAVGRGRHAGDRTRRLRHDDLVDVACRRPARAPELVVVQVGAA
jgi:hypothetical protein